jgi:hypothetical protein
MSDNYDSLSDEELIALAKYKTHGADALSDDEAILAAKHLAPKKESTSLLSSLASIPAVATDIAYGTAKAVLSTGMGVGARAYGALTGQNDMPLNKLLESSSEAVEKAAPSVGSMTGLETASPYKAVMGALEPLATAPKKLGDIITNVTGSGDIGGSVEGYLNVLGIPGLHLAGKKLGESAFALENKFTKTPSEVKVSGVVEDLKQEKASQEQAKELAKQEAEATSPAALAQKEVEARQASLEQDVRDKMPEEMKETVSEPTKAETLLADVQEKAAIGEASPIEVAQAKQAAKTEQETSPLVQEVTVNFEKKAESEHINKILGNALPELARDAKTPEEVIAHLSNTKDVADKNIVGKGIGLFTKGFLFEKLKTNNPLIKYTHNLLSDAVDKYTVQNKKLIDKALAPALRELSTKEKVEVSSLLQEAMKEQVVVTPELMSKHGFTQAQINAATTLQDVHKTNLDSINRSRTAIGKPPVPEYIGYMLGMADGNFKKIIYKDVVGKDGKITPEVVSIVGSNIRGILNNRVKKLLENNPGWSAGPEKYNGVNKTGHAGESLQEALMLLSDHNPNMAEFATAMEAVLKDESYHSLGGVKHTMQKKGISGMEGSKFWRSDKQNADDFFNAQVRGTQTLSKWAALSEAAANINKVLKDPMVQDKHRNAVEMSKDYLDNAMGKNPSARGKDFDNIIGEIGKSLGFGPALAKQGIHAIRSAVNTVFFTANPRYYLANTLQPQMALPQIKSFMKQRGIDVNVDPTAWTDLTANGYMSVLKRNMPEKIANSLPEKLSKLTPFEEKMWQYGDEHGQSSSQIIIAHPHISKDVSFYLDKYINTPIGSTIEGMPRASTFAAMSKMLKDAGYERDPDIFSTARQLTDLIMGDYRHHEQANIHNEFGMVGGINFLFFTPKWFN